MHSRFHMHGRIHIYSGMKAMIMAVMMLLASALPAAAETKLVMFTSDSCPFCKAWERDVGASYDVSPYAAKLPLSRVAFNGPAPAGLALNAPVLGTPTFIVVRDGKGGRYARPAGSWAAALVVLPAPGLPRRSKVCAPK